MTGDITPEKTPKRKLPEALEKNLWQKGQSGNPAGRPKGSISVIGNIKQLFENDPIAFQEFVDKYLKDPRNRQHIVEMIDGSPQKNVLPPNVNIEQLIIVRDKDESPVIQVAN